MLTIKICKTPTDYKQALAFRQKQFFDERNIKDPYVWSLGHENHHHFLLIKDSTLIGYAHIQYWLHHRATLRIIVITEKGKGYGSYLMEQCEKLLQQDGIRTLHTEAHPTAVQFYQRLGYTSMPFDDPDGHPTDANDTPLGKKLQ